MKNSSNTSISNNHKTHPTQKYIIYDRYKLTNFFGFSNFVFYNIFNSNELQNKRLSKDFN